ncbi:MAG: acyl-CoA dehydrogenase family protein [Alphaproteobacteria bacterium]|nr:acyl-CoA dehydrogenase family protein [Alphaproteobacteria bacterium]
MNASVEQQAFRSDARDWLAANFPPALKDKSYRALADKDPALAADLEVWRSRLAGKGWGAPTWPAEYGGAGLGHPQAKVIQEEMEAIGAFNPIPTLAGMGVTMVGPTMLEYGTDDQKARHLRGMASGEVRWCLGLSEPNAGSDLASLGTKAEDKGDHFVVNGQKIWTSGADISQWCGALVRTDPAKPKRDGISFVLLPMDQPGVRTRPIPLISGASPFCETYFDDARADKADLLGELNDGWSVIKRLLQHERQSQTSAGRRKLDNEEPLQDLAKRYVGTDADGTLSDKDLRARLTDNLMAAKAHELTIARITAEARGQVKVSAAASILKNSATRVAQTKAELKMEIMGAQGVGWDGEAYEADELASVREWLFGKAASIYGGSFEVQYNIISKNILGLPETTQKG